MSSKIKAEELQSVKQAVYNLNQAKMILGDASHKAYKAQLNVVSMEKILEQEQKNLEETYGPITLDLETGEYEKSED